MSPSRSPHGTYARYVNGPCRCAKCTKANTDYCREARRRKGVRPLATYNAERLMNAAHGSRTWYSRGCRCVPCVEWARNEIRQRRDTDRNCPSCGAAVKGVQGLATHAGRLGCRP